MDLLLQISRILGEAQAEDEKETLDEVAIEDYLYKIEQLALSRYEPCSPIKALS